MGRAWTLLFVRGKTNKVVNGVLRDVRRSLLSKCRTFHATHEKSILIAGHKERAEFPAPIFMKLTNFQ